MARIKISYHFDGKIMYTGNQHMTKFDLQKFLNFQLKIAIRFLKGSVSDPARKSCQREKSDPSCIKWGREYVKLNPRDDYLACQSIGAKIDWHDNQMVRQLIDVIINRRDALFVPP